MCSSLQRFVPHKSISLPPPLSRLNLLTFYTKQPLQLLLIQNARVACFHSLQQSASSPLSVLRRESSLLRRPLLFSSLGAVWLIQWRIPSSLSETVEYMGLGGWQSEQLNRKGFEGSVHFHLLSGFWLYSAHSVPDGVDLGKIVFRRMYGQLWEQVSCSAEIDCRLYL